MAEALKDNRAIEQEQPRPQAKARRRATDLTGSVNVTYSGDVQFSAPTTEQIRNMYNNKDATRFLGSYIAAPIVDVLASYIGLPNIVADDKALQETLDNILEANEAAIGEVQRMTLRDGAAYLRVSYELPPGGSLLYGRNEPGRLILTPLAVDRVQINRDALSGDINYAKITDSIAYTDTTGMSRVATIETIITPETEEVKTTDGLALPGIPYGVKENKSGLVPLVEFVNDPDPITGQGVSEIARIEPFMRLYHDVAYNAAQGSKLHSVPKLHFAVEDKRRLLTDNGGSATTRSLNLTGRDTIITSPTDKVSFIEASNPIGSSIDLLHILHYCMIESSQTPEYILGVHMPSSYASTAEQSPVWEMKVQRKQRMLASAWWKVGRMILAKLSFHENLNAATFNSRVYYELPDTRNKKEIADQQEVTVRAVVSAVREKLMSWEAGVATLGRVFQEMQKEFVTEDGQGGEKQAILTGAAEREALEQPANVAQTVDIDQAVEAVNKLLKGGA